jgi:glycosyltransferase involved in cell wall biosynthesis
MDLDRPRVGIIIPTRNRFDLTRAAIASVQTQTYPHWRLVVVDDGSDDGSADALADLVADDQRITLVRRTRSEGAPAARQTGLEALSEPLIATLDSDDLWLPGKLEAQVNAFVRAVRKRSEVGVVLCWHEYFDTAGERRGRVVKPDVRGCSLPFPWYNMSTPLIARRALEEAGGFGGPGGPPLRTTEHLDLFLRLMPVTRVTVVPRLLVRCIHHSHPRNSDGLGTRGAADESAAVLRQHDADLAARPRERAWLHALVGARYLSAGHRRRGLRHLATGIAAANASIRAKIVRYYAPFTVKHVLRPPWRPQPAAAPAKRALESSARPAVSVVVMAYRNGRTVVDAVRSVLMQEAPDPFEVIVVTSGGDRAAMLVRDAFPDVAVVESHRRLLPGAARNAGLAATSGDIVAFLASDCRAEPGWLSRRLAHHRAGHSAVASAITYAGPSRPWAWASHYLLNAGRLPGRPAGVVCPPDPAAHSLSFDRAHLERVGPFDESLRIGEDTELALRLADLGTEIWFDPALRTAHVGHGGFSSMLRDHFRRGVRRYRFRVATGRSSPASSPAWILARNAARLVLRTRWTLTTCWRYGRGERWRVALSLPWIVAGRVAGTAGMALEEFRAAVLARGGRRGALAPAETPPYRTTAVRLLQPGERHVDVLDAPTHAVRVHPGGVTPRDLGDRAHELVERQLHP